MGKKPKEKLVKFAALSKYSKQTWKNEAAENVIKCGIT